MATDNCIVQAIGPVRIAQARCILEQIATSANSLDIVCYHRGMDGNTEDLVSQIEELRKGIKLIGLLADTGCGKLDGTDRPDVRGGIEEWLLPPSYPQNETNSTRAA